MEGGGTDGLRRRRSLQERLGLVCCGSTWGNRPSTMSIDGEEDDDPLAEVIRTLSEESNLDPDCVLSSPRMNLAAALAAERNSRSTVVVVADDGGESLTENNKTPARRISLMRLLEETGEDEDKEGNRDLVCCVCMGRKKGAALVPCGHTFCRVCSRELWLNRGSCPLCNRSIIQVLDIF